MYLVESSNQKCLNLTVRHQKGNLTLGDKLEAIAAHKGNMWFADIGQRFQVTESIIRTTTDLFRRLTRSEEKLVTYDHLHCAKNFVFSVNCTKMVA